MRKVKKVISDYFKLIIINRIWTFKKREAKILKFIPKVKTISDNDLVSILMGIIKMVREDERTKILDTLRRQNKKN